MTYYLAQGGQQSGPFELQALTNMLGAGHIALTDLVWTDGMAEWEPVSQVLPPVAASVPLAGPPPPPPPPVAPPAAYVQPVIAASESARPVPPGMHWAVVLILGMITFGLFAIIWLFVEASFVKKISPKRNGRGLLFLIVLMELFLGLFAFLAYYNDHVTRIVPTGMSSDSMELFTPILGGFLVPLLWILAIVAIFRMRRGLLTHYNSVENIQLRLSGVMTFFFNIYYVQHHLSRIARWKKTGQLTPQ
jgi:hypothetical protein